MNLALFVPALLASTLVAAAEPYFYESFDYALGEDALTAAPLWETVRFPGSEADVLAGSLSYRDSEDRELLTAGAKVLVDTAEEEKEVRHRAPLDLSSHQGPAVWVSLLGQQTAGDARRFINLSFMVPDDVVQPPDSNKDEEEAFALGTSSSENPSGWSLYNRASNNGRRVALSAVPTSQTSLLLGRIELNHLGSEVERYTFWINPPLGTVPAEADGLSFTSANTAGEEASDFAEWAELTGMRIGAGVLLGASPAASWLVDEIRVGAGWADVLPWSGPLELLSPLPAPGPDGFEMVWRPSPGRTDIVEVSTDMLTWTSHETSRHTGQPGELSARFKVPAPPAGTPSFYARVRRQP
jgi:hypothetical protein